MSQRQGSYNFSSDTATAPPNRHRTLKRAESRVDKLKRQLSQGASQWMGLEESSDESKNIWLQRRAAFHGTSLIMGRGVSKKCKDKLEQQEDGMPCVHDPYHRPGTAYRTHDEVDYGRPLSQSSAVTRSSMGTRRHLAKKDSVAKMALDGISQVLGFRGGTKPRSRMYSAQSKSLPPASVPVSVTDEVDGQVAHLGVSQAIQEADELDDEVFFDNKSHGTSALDLRPQEVPPVISMATVDSSSIPTRGWRQGVEHQPIPGTPGVVLDEPDFFGGVPGRMMEKVTTAVMEKPEKRRLGEGIIGRLFNRTLKSSPQPHVREQLEEIHDHRPYFTYWVTFVQIVAFIVSVSVYGIAPIGVSKKIISQDVLVTALYNQRIGFEEPENFWIGPRQVDLIHLGAKFAPCMRKDSNIDELHKNISKRESNTACCAYSDNSGCYQSSEGDCNSFRADWLKWKIPSDYANDENRTSGTVCGQDPRWCIQPSGYQWEDDITKWPVCTKNDDHTADRVNEKHMNCTVLSRPCCIGVKGECQILTEQHCEAKRGYFHPNATLCSQVKCLGKVCGLIKFLNEDHPDQFYRLWLSLFLHAGVFHVVLTVLFQFLIMRDTEKLCGCVRIAVIYFGAGIGGNLASAIFLPYHVEVGPAGSQFGILSTLWVEVIHSWPLINKPWIALAKLCGFTVALFILGLLPWIDNYAHIFGFIFGIGLSFAVLPYITFGKQDHCRKIVVKVVSSLIVVMLYIVLFLVFYVTPIRECQGCRYLNCIPFTSDFCENMGVEIDATETKFEWENVE